MISKIELFKNVNISNYKESFIIKNYKKNETIFHEQEICTSLGIIIDGEVKISTLTHTGNEYIIRILNSNDIFGETLLFSSSNLYLGDGIATKNTTIIYIKKAILLELLKDQVFLLNFLNILSINSKKMNQRLKLYSQKTIEDRIMFYLALESKRLNSNIIPITSKEKLATILNIPRPSLSRELINLKNKSLIYYDKYKIIMLNKK